VGNGATLGEFLRNRRGRLRPADVGLPGGIGRRQTPGLRRAELAALAGVSVDYYVRLEQGRDTNPGTGVLDALATALRLDDDERAHLHRLARGGLPHPRNGLPHPRNGLPHPRGGSVAGTVRPGLLRLLDLVRPAPAYILDPLSTILGYNAEGAGLMAGLVGWPVARRNLIRYVFTHPEARDVILSWPEITADCVADLRTGAGADPASPHLATLVADLCADSAEFARLWRHYDVRVNTGGQRRFHHPAAGAFDLTSEILTAVDGRRLLVFHAAPGSPAQEALRLLALRHDVGGVGLSWRE